MADVNDLFDRLDAFAIPPLHEWWPEKTVDIDIRIDANGDWRHQDSLIRRRRMVRLFAGVLRLDEGEYFLVTPPVRYRIQVEEAPFLAVELRVKGEGGARRLYLRTNVDDVVEAGEDHPIVVTTDPDSGAPSPRVHVRDGLEAKITRPVFYELAELLEPGDGGMLGVAAGGCFFPFGAAGEA